MERSRCCTWSLHCTKHASSYASTLHAILPQWHFGHLAHIRYQLTAIQYQHKRVRAAAVETCCRAAVRGHVLVRLDDKALHLTSLHICQPRTRDPGVLCATSR
jgi:hypothetical protein